VLHGAITVDGVSLTVNALPAPGVVQVSLVPFTRAHTTLGQVAAGERVHVEADVLGKYVRQLCRSEK
jgi:riboflavin synthase